MHHALIDHCHADADFPLQRVVWCVTDRRSDGIGLPHLDLRRRSLCAVAGRALRRRRLHRSSAHGIGYQGVCSTLRPLFKLETRPAGLLASCRASSESAELRLISIPDGRVIFLASGIHSSWNADVSPDGRSVAAFRGGACPPGPPVCQTHAVLIDVASKSERELLPSGYHLGATLEWNVLGLTLFQPECAEAGCAGPGDKSGTFVWDGSAFKKWSDLRFVAKSGDWTLLERLTSFRREPRAVVIRGPQGESELSAGHALTISDTGETLVWIPGSRLLARLAPDGRVLWRAAFDGEVMKMIGADALLAWSPTNTLDLYDLKRMLRFAIDAKPAMTGVVR